MYPKPSTEMRAWFYFPKNSPSSTSWTECNPHQDYGASPHLGGALPLPCPAHSGYHVPDTWYLDVSQRKSQIISNEACTVFFGGPLHPVTVLGRILHDSRRKSRQTRGGGRVRSSRFWVAGNSWRYSWMVCQRIVTFYIRFISQGERSPRRVAMQDVCF